MIGDFDDVRIKERPDLVNGIIAYSTRAFELEGVRKGLIEKIMEVVESEIIPEISPHLPSGYSISAKDSKVVGGKNYDDVIPTYFNVWLVVYHDGKPIRANSPYSEIIGRIHRNLRRKLDIIAEKYHFGEIIPVGKPVHI